ncbi:MAG: DUF5652 family protein [Candidatus Woesearchaeota archaeon]
MVEALPLYLQLPYVLVWSIPLLIWVVVWKAMALWKSARNKQLGWFITLLLIQTLGILDLLYILFFQREKK